MTIAKLGALTFKALKAKQRATRDGFSEALTLRVHRAISWFGRAEAEKSDLDVRFILLLIAFNSAYASEIGAQIASEKGAFRAYFDTLVQLDKGRRIYNAVWEKFAKEVRLLLSNRYVFAPFWHHHNGAEGYDDWEDRLAVSNRQTASAIKRLDTSRTLCNVFDRLYVLRNQLVHGGATWNSSVNRHQVQDGAAVLAWLLPVFIDIMMDNPGRDWGSPFYPVVDSDL